ncbi:MAG: T9SS type A sorting domain-containing protein [Flavobacteriaceae bacterium]|nr:T9SS type A sorting domain-containing protein [Flavobacteriaceae bacterium]
MIKKLLCISFLLLSMACFSQKTVAKLSAAPNPFTNLTQIKFEANNSQSVFFIVKNILGKTVYKKTYRAKKGKNSFVFYRNNLQSGMYIYLIQSSKDLISKRFVIR